MTDENDRADQTEEIAGWMLMNHERQNWDLLKMLAKGWPDATAAELAQAWDRMTEMALEQFDKDVRPIKNRAKWRTIEGGKDDTPKED